MGNEVKLTKRVIVAIGPTEGPDGNTLGYEVPPLADGVKLIHVEPNFYQGVYFAVLDVTDSADGVHTPWWAPGMTPPTLVPTENVEAAHRANQIASDLRIDVPSHLRPVL